MTPDLASYDIIEISSSAGKDSQAMLFKVAELLRERGILDRGVVVHADRAARGQAAVICWAAC